MTSQLENLTAFGNWNLPLRIQRRGHFFTDDGFQDYRRHFESAAKDLLQEFDFSRSENPFKSYRRLRDRQFSGTDKAAKVAEESDKYKIVMDVEGFQDGDLKVTISGPNEIVVEGCQEVSKEGAFFNRSFKRRFSLPGLALVQDASSFVSSDNVLTVTIPKKVQEITSSSEQTTSSTQQHMSESKTLESKVEEAFQKLKEDSKSAFALNDFHKRSSLDSSTLLDLQIVPRQSFFNDSYFENVRHNFQKSIEDLMEKRRERISSAPDRELFQKVRVTKEENTQAVSVTEDSKEHKIVLDVHGFSEGDLKVRAVSECELLVEGKVEKKTQYTSCGHTFSRRFVLPHDVNIRESTSALSSEGILTIIVPKRLEAIDYTIPVKSEAATVLSNVIRKEQERETSSSTNVHRVPVVQEEEKILNVQQNVQQQSGTSVASTKSVSSTKTTDSVTSHTTDQRTQFVPINLEGNQSVNVTEETKNTKYIVTEPSDVVKESQKLVSESSRLIEEINSSEKRQPNEHFVPVQLDSGITVNTSNTQTKSTVSTQQSTNLVSDVSSTTSCQSTPQPRLSEPFKAAPSGTRVVPISLKGSFYNESIFDDARQNIEREVQDVFSKYRKTSVVDEQKQDTTVQKTSTQDATSLVKNGQATSTILDDAHSYKIVLDVFGFEERDLKVRVSGFNEISIEGNVEKSKGGTVSKHSFQRTFQLPDCVDLERTFTALSEEGILTVTVPKKNQLLLLGKKESPIQSRLRRTSESQEEKSTMVIDSSGIVQEKRSNVQQAHGLESIDSSSTISSSVPMSPTGTITSETTGQHREYVVPVSIEDVSDLASEAGSVKSVSTLASEMTTASATSKDIPHNILSTSTSASSIDTQIQNKSTASTDETALQVHRIDSGARDKASTITSSHDNSRDIVTRTLFNLPIVPRGHFFDDIFFQDSRSMYETLLRNKMNRFNRSTSFVDDLGFFKSLRDRRITGGNQVATLSEDDQFNKIVLDVHGFNENNLRVKAVSENELLIEGEVEERTGCSLSKKTFRKQFLLPGNVDLRAASSALSSDGVLTIKVPKKL